MALDLKLNDKVNPTPYAWQAGVGRSMFISFLFDQTGRFLASGAAHMNLINNLCHRSFQPLPAF